MYATPITYGLPQQGSILPVHNFDFRGNALEVDYLCEIRDKIVDIVYMYIINELMISRGLRGVMGY